MSRARWLTFALVAASLCACNTVPLAENPMVRESREGFDQALFTVDWWTRVVPPITLEYSPRELGRPALDGTKHMVIVATRDGLIHGIDSRTHKTRWSFKAAAGFAAGPEAKDGVAYVPCRDGALYALDSQTGKLLWKHEQGEELETAPVIADGKVLVGTQTDTLVAIDQKTGRWIWQYRRDQPSGFTIRGFARPAVANGLVYAGFSDGALVALNLQDGTAKWEKALSTPGGQFLDVDSSPQIDGENVYAASYKDGVYALKLDNGNVVWKAPVTGVVHLLARDEVIYATGDRNVTALDKNTGKTAWTLNLGQREGQEPVYSNGVLIVPTNHELTFVDPASGKSRLAWNPGRGVSAPALVRGRTLYVMSNGGFLYSLQLSGKHAK